MPKERVKDIADKLWKFDNGEYYIDFYNEFGPFKNAQEFAKFIFRTEIQNCGFDDTQDEYDLTDYETQLVYELIYNKIKDSIIPLDEALRQELQRKLTESKVYRNVEERDATITLTDYDTIEDTSVGEILNFGTVCGFTRVNKTVYIIIKDSDNKLLAYSMDAGFPYEFKLDEED